MTDSGLNVDAGLNIGVYLPAGTPPAIVARLDAEVLKVLKDEALRKRFVELGMDVTPVSQAALVERILHAGLAYSDAVDPETSLVICNEPEPAQGKGYQAHELGVPLVSDAEFMDHLDGVIGGTGIDSSARPMAGAAGRSSRLSPSAIEVTGKPCGTWRGRSWSPWAPHQSPPALVRPRSLSSGRPQVGQKANPSG